MAGVAMAFLQRLKQKAPRTIADNQYETYQNQGDFSYG